MSSLINISESCAIAIHALMMLVPKNTQRSAKEISEVLHTSLHHTIRVMHRLRQAGFVRSVRGPTGGFVLAVNPIKTSFMDVYETIEGPYDCKCCVFINSNKCSSEKCHFSSLTRKVDELALEFLRGNKLATPKGKTFAKNEKENC